MKTTINLQITTDKDMAIRLIDGDPKGKIDTLLYLSCIDDDYYSFHHLLKDLKPGNQIQLTITQQIEANPDA